MMQDDEARKLEELDRLLNDPDVKMDPTRVWSLLAELSERDTGGSAQLRTHRGTDAGIRAAGGSAD